MNKFLLITLVTFLTLPTFAQDKKAKKWDVNNPTGTYNEVEFALDEGTWMNLDISPDGKTMLFDMLGDIYKMPIGGGQAKVLREGLAWEVQPRFSPDGSKILFTSDAGGGDNAWVMNVDGSDAKQITKEKFRLLNNAVWMPDNQYIVARKHFTSQRSLGAGELWLYHISGGSGVQLTKRKNDQQDVNEPCISPDGRYVYFSEDVYPGGFFQYNKDPNSQIFVIKRYDREKGKIETIVRGPGGAVRPQISNDGKKLAFIRRVRTKTVLFVHDLETGEEYPIYDGLSKDQQEAWTIFGSYTGFDWMPDDKNIVIWGKGKFWSVDAKTGTAKNIPFKVKAKHKMAETLRFENPAFTENFEVKVIRHLRTSPDGKMVVFNAVGHLWKMDLPNGKPERISGSSDLEFEPSFSPDGKTIVYVSWDDEEMGAVKLLKLDVSEGEEMIFKLTDKKGIYRTPSFSSDGKKIVFRKEGGNGHQGFTHAQKTGIYTMNADGSDLKFVTAEGEDPVFSKDMKRVFYNTGGSIFGSLKKAFNSIKLDGTDKKVIFKTKYATQFTPSPDNKWIAFTDLYKVYIAAMPLSGKAMDLSGSTKAIPVAQVARDAGINLHWSSDNEKLFWTLGNEYFSDKLTRRFTFLEGALDSVPPMDTTGLKIDLELAYDSPEGMIAFTNARIIKMDWDKVI